MAVSTCNSVKVARLLGLKSWKVIICIVYSNLFFQYTGSTVSKFKMILTKTLIVHKTYGQNSSIFTSHGKFSMWRK